MKDKNDMIDLKEERDFEALLRSALLETTREELRADEESLRDADIPPVPESLTSRINALIAEDTVSGLSGASEDRPRDERKGSIISLAGRRLSSRSLASAAATVILAGAAIYGAGSVLQGGVGVSGSTATLRWRKEPWRRLQQPESWRQCRRQLRRQRMQLRHRQRCRRARKVQVHLR